MNDTKRVRYLKIDRGRFYYQRRVPKDLQADLREKMWRRPCGDVTYSKAVQMIVTWAEEHDSMIADLENPAKRLAARAKVTQAVKQQMRDAYADLGLPRFSEMSESLPEKKQFYTLERLPRPWQAAAKMLSDAEMARRGNINSPWLIHRIEERVSAVREGLTLDDVFTVPGFKDVQEYLSTQLDADTRNQIKVIVTARPAPIDDADYLDRIKEAFQIGFGPSVSPPSDSDQRDEFEFVKRKLERKIAELSPAPDTISHVLERYCDFNGIRPATRSKYRRDVGRLVAMIGDVPIKHVRAEDLSNLRNQQLPTVAAASVHATFTPIKGMFRHAVDEQIIDTNPMSGVKLPQEKRSVEERKWKKLDPDEMTVILNAIEHVWGKPVRGLDDDRRVAIAMLVRVLAFTAMRPAEVMRLTPLDVLPRSIHVHGS